jgi:hypothetical protein
MDEIPSSAKEGMQMILTQKCFGETFGTKHDSTQSFVRQQIASTE